MESVTETVANFATQAKFTDLPEKVSHEIKRVVLDSVGNAIYGLSSEKGSIAAKLAAKLGGPPESTIIGTKDKVSSTNAAFANGELINALDFDATSPGGHDVPGLVGGALAIAESCGVSGKDLILAIALSFEISARFKVRFGAIVDNGPEKGKMQFPPVFGQSTYALAAAVSVGKILNLSQQKMANAIGIAGCLCPPNIARKSHETVPFRMTKYGVAGAVSQTGVVSALLAEMGYTGDTDLFDGEYGFWKYIGSEARGEEMLSDLGVEWCSDKIDYKQYPCGNLFAGVLDKFIQIIEENGFQPDDIEQVVAQPHPILQFRAWGENALRSPDDYYMHGPYAFACAAHRINPAHWHDPEVRHDPRLIDFMQRVTMVLDEKEFGLAKLEDPRANLMRLEVVAKGKTFKEKIPHPRGRWTPEEFRFTDQDLINKFTDNASRIIPSNRVNEAAKTTLELEKLGNISHLMEMYSP